MPTPQAGETRKDFVNRCIPIVLEEGTAEDGTQAAAICNSMWEQEKMSSTFLIDDFIIVKPGEPFRLFPFGKLVKNGKERIITPEIAALFKLPHFKPPIKLGSHDEPTPAGGHIVGLEVRDDGLYALPEWNEKGGQAMQDGAYRYHSPEVIWEDGAMENPATGELINGPLIVGDALLHMPHLGEAAKLYGVEPITKGDKPMTVEMVEIPKNFWEEFKSMFTRPEPKPEPELVNIADSEEYQAVVTERDDYKAQLEELRAKNEKDMRIEKYRTELKNAKVDPELAELVAGLEDEQAEKIMQQFKALSAQAGDLEEELGRDQPAIDEPAGAFDAAIRAVMEEKKIAYHQAFAIVQKEQPDLFDAYVKGE